MIRYVVTGMNKNNQRVNIFDDGRSYKLKRYAQSICEQMETVFDFSADLKVEPLEVLTEAEKLKKLIERAIPIIEDAYAESSAEMRLHMDWVEEARESL